MGNVRLYGSTSGYTELAPPAVAPDGVLSLPSGVGTLLTAEGGKVLQIVRATDTTARTTTSTSFVDVTGMAVTITPTAATSRVIIVAVFMGQAVGSGRVSFQITDSSNTVLSGAEDMQMTGSQNNYNNFNFWGYIESGTVSPATYKLRMKRNSATSVAANNDLNTGQLYAIELSA